MEQLHLVGSTPDLKGLIFSTQRGSTSGEFWVSVDDQLLHQMERIAADRRRGGAPKPSKASKPASPSRLTPREMQARLRVGQTLSEVAEEAGVDEEWVARFAGPILAEQAQVVTRALAAIPTRPKLGASRFPLGPSVARNLADRGIVPPQDVLASAWSAYQVGDGRWGVRFSYVSGGRTLAADWDYDAHSGEVTARGRMATDLGFVGPDSRRPAVRPPDGGHDDGGAEPAEPTEHVDQLRLLPTSKTAATAGSASPPSGGVWGRGPRREKYDVAAVGQRASKAAVTAPLPAADQPAKAPARRRRPASDH